MMLYITNVDRLSEYRNIEKYKNTEFYLIWVFGTRSEYHEGYDPGERSYTETIPEITTYATTDEVALKQALLQLVKDNAKFVFFKVARFGKYEMETKIEVS